MPYESSAASDVSLERFGLRIIRAMQTSCVKLYDVWGAERPGLADVDLPSSAAR